MLRIISVVVLSLVIGITWMLTEQFFYGETNHNMTDHIMGGLLALFMVDLYIEEQKSHRKG